MAVSRLASIELADRTAHALEQAQRLLEQALTDRLVRQVAERKVRADRAVRHVKCVHARGRTEAG